MVGGEAVSYPKVALPATGGGAFLLCLLFQRYLLAICVVLIAATLWGAYKTLQGMRSLRE